MIEVRGFIKMATEFFNLHFCSEADLLFLEIKKPQLAASLWITILWFFYG